MLRINTVVIAVVKRVQQQMNFNGLWFYNKAVKSSEVTVLLFNIFTHRILYIKTMKYLMKIDG